MMKAEGYHMLKLTICVMLPVSFLILVHDSFKHNTHRSNAQKHDIITHFSNTFVLLITMNRMTLDY